MGKPPDKDKSGRKPRTRDDTFTGKFTDAWVKKTPHLEKGVQYAEHLKKGLSLMLYVAPKPHETKTWRALFYHKGKPRAEKLGTYRPNRPGHLSLENARKKAYKFDPDKAIAKAEAGTLREIAQDWIVAHVEKRKLRTEYEIKRQLKVYVLPRLGNDNIFDVTRLEVNKFLDRIEKNHGASQADSCLATIRSIMGWYAVRNHQYTSPIIKGMKRDTRTLAQRSRERVLTNDEIKLVWAACDEMGVFGGLVRMLLLTGQRLRKVATMRRSDVVDGVWTVSKEHQEKGTIERVKLPQLALDVIEAQPEIKDNPFVFPASKGDEQINSFSQRKSEIDELLPDVPHWTLHDLRRTARSLMAALDVPDHIAELALGHKLTGVLAVYNRHKYEAEKTKALQAVADHVARILHPTDATNVVSIAKEISGRTTKAKQV